MQRRHVLTSLAGLACAASLPCRLLADTRSGHIVVVGAGIVGASIAYRLTRHGVRVTVLDRSGPAAGASSRSFAWINADPSKQPLHYHEFNRLGLLSHRVLEQELPGFPVQWGGALQWCTEKGRAQEMHRQVRQLEQWGYPIRLVEEQEFLALEGQLHAGRVLAASFAENEGFLDPLAATRLLLDKARDGGAEVVFPSEVADFELRGGRIAAIKTSSGTMTADAVVIAGGVGTQALAAMAGVVVPLVPAPGLLVHTRAIPQLLSRVVIGPDAHIKQYRDGRAVIGDDLSPPKTPAHDSLQSQPADFPDTSYRDLHAQRIIREAAQYLPQLDGAPVERVTVGWRPMPRDGYPIVGAARSCPNLYIVVTHSGVTLAPLLAELVSMEILDGVDVRMLAPYRPARFATA